MAFTNRTKISEYDATAANNINLGTAASPAARLGEYGVNLDAEAMRPSDTNGALRELMAHLKAMDVGTNPLTTPNLGEPTADVIGLNTSYSEDGNEAQGSIFWNPDELTANLVQNGTILQVGQEIQINVRNSTASDIADGSAVMATGTLGASGRITIGLMDASSAANAKMFIGIATETITAGGDGKVTWFGKVRDIDTSGFTQPSILWCDPATAGGLTETQPSAPNAKLAVAYVIYSETAQNGGTIFVRGTPGQLLSECHDVQISGTPADNEVLAYNDATGAFINQTAAEAGLQSVLAEGAFVDGDKTKLDGIETGADVTDATNVAAAGAVMDAELTNEAAVKSIDQALTTTSDVQFNQVTGALVGNADTATTLATARNIALSGDVTGSASFNGSADISITATVADDSHSHSAYLTEVTANDVNSGAAADGYVLTADGLGGAAWEVAASGGLSDGSTLTTGFTFNDNAIAKFGTGGTDLQLKSDGSDIQATLGTGINFYLNAPTSGAFYAVKEGSANNDVPVPARILNSYSLAAANGGGVGLDLASPNGNGIVKNAATFYARYNDVTNGAEDTRVEVYGYTAGAFGAMATICGYQQSSFPSGITTSSDGSSTDWKAAYDWGNHADAGYASYADTTANFTNDLQQGGSAVVTQADVDDTPVDGVTAAPISSNWAYDHQNATVAHGVSGAVVGTNSTQTLTNKTITGLAQGSTISDGVGTVGIGYRNVPIVSATTVGTTHVGKCLTASTTVTVPNSTMAAGDVVSIFNNSASGITLTLNPTLAYVNGADAASATLSAYGVATVLFISSTTCVVTGNVS